MLGNTSWNWLEQPAAIITPVASEPALADTEVAPSLSWDVDTSIQNYESAEQPWRFFDRCDPFDPGAGSTQVDGSHPANPAYLGSYSGDFLAASAPEFFSASSTLPDLAPNGNFLVDWSSLSNDTLASSSRDFTGSALFGSSEPHATRLLPATQDLQTHAGIGISIKAGELDGRHK
jgi:hypothetical protein